MQRFLTPEAREIIETEDDTGAIVNALGTHFMTSAISGGLKRFASVLDVRNENVAEQHVIALSIKVKDTEPKSNTSAPGNIGEEMAVAKAIYSKIGNYITTTVGETYVEGQDAAWVRI